MKLRYYLRGLAVGILLATVILSIANADKRPLSDAEIRVKALQLGMVDGESARLSDRQGNDDREESQPQEQEPTGDDLEKSGPGGADPDEAAEDGMAEAEEPTESEPAEDTSTENEPVEDTSTENEPVEDAPTENEPTEDGPTESEPAETAPREAVKIEIKSGANSYTVSKKLAEAGLVESAASFDTFLCDNGYARTIRAGTYHIVPGTGEEEIAKMIAR